MIAATPSKSMNTYKFRFFSRCPTDGDTVSYTLTIEALHTIKAEDIRSACAEWPDGFHEVIADALRDKLGGRQVITAVHRGVQITTVRGAL